MAGRPLRRLLTRFRPRVTLPRHTIRLRLTLLYGGLFLASGAGLLALTYVLATNTFPVLVQEHSSLGGSAAFGAGGLPQELQQAFSTLYSQATHQRDQALHELLIQSGIALAVMTVISLGLGWLVSARALGPLRTITVAARRISASNLHQRLALASPNDELKELADTFDGLLARLEAAFDAQRQFVANASHELRTPLARQRALVEVALADRDPTIGSLQSTCELVLAASVQQERLIEALLTLAHSQRGLRERNPVDLPGLIRGVLASRQEEALGRRVSVGVGLGPAVAMGDADLIERLAVNLVDNALAHNVADGWVRVTTETRAGHAILSVANTGPVIPAAELDRLLEPFQRLGTDRIAVSDGLGLGLSIVRAIVGAHGGQLRMRPLRRGGLQIQIRFPRFAMADTREPPLPAAGLTADEVPGELHSGV
jgi:signal transduction histidine kinase